MNLKIQNYAEYRAVRLWVMSSSLRGLSRAEWRAMVLHEQDSEMGQLAIAGARMTTALESMAAGAGAIAEIGLILQDHNNN